MSRFLNESLRSLDAYTPGEQPRDQQYILWIHMGDYPLVP